MVKIGPRYTGNRRWVFRVWAPYARTVELKTLHPEARVYPMHTESMGYWATGEITIEPGTRYVYVLDGSTQRPDPASPCQPEGVHGPSQVVDHHRFIWEDQDWEGIGLERMIMYEIHTGTFTRGGRFEDIIPRLKELSRLGINTVELMPVAQFPGHRNWGYDGVFPYAVQDSYGGPQGLKQLVNSCHLHGFSVVLDVVYNHLGPEGNFLGDFGPYFTSRYTTFWGPAINFDQAYSDQVRNYFIQNALYWFENYHIDGLRLDAVHAIYDMSARHFLKELSQKVKTFSRTGSPDNRASPDGEGSEKKSFCERTNPGTGEKSWAGGRRLVLIAESDLNDPVVIRPQDQHGYGIDAQWCDDFHHSVHALLTGEKRGYYLDFGNTEHLKTVLKQGFYYSWKYSNFRKKHFGEKPTGVDSRRFVVFSQNHDQVGNRPDGLRLSGLVDLESLKLGCGMLFLGPFVPLVFMGQEYAEDAPFYYFISHSDQELIRAVREGRKKEFRAFLQEQEHSGAASKQHPGGAPEELFPDPQERNTFEKSKLNWELNKTGHHKVLFEFYRKLISIRKNNAALSNLGFKATRVFEHPDQNLVIFQRLGPGTRALVAANFGNAPVKCRLAECTVWNEQKGKSERTGKHRGKRWEKIFDSADTLWMGPGETLPSHIHGSEEAVVLPRSFGVYTR